MLARNYLSKPWLPAILILACTFLVWGGTVRHGFVWDDYLFIVDNECVRSLKNVPEMFCSLDAQHAPTEDPCPLFRPLRTVQFALLHALGGKATPQPWPFHLANVLWHALAAVLVCSVAGLLMLRRAGSDQSETVVAQWIPLLAGLAFALNPAVSEVVCWAKSLDDIMATVFVLASLRWLLKWKENPVEYWIALGWFAAAVYSKESAVPFPLVVLLVFRLVHQLSWKRSATLAAGFFGVSLVYTLHRQFVIGHLAQCAPLSGSYGQTLLDTIPVIPKYARLLFGIPPFCIDYGYMTGQYSILSGEVLLGLLILGSFMAAGVWAWKRSPMILLGLCWISAFLLPVSNLVPMMQYMAERFLYLPLVGLIFVLAALAIKIRKAPLVGAIGLVMVLVWGQASVARSAIWQDELNLFVRTWQENPHCKRVEDNLVVAIFRLPHMQQIFPLDAKTKKMSGMRMVSPQQAELAIQTLQEARRLVPDNAIVASALGLACAQAGQKQKALETLSLTTKLDPSAQNYFNLGALQMELEQNSEAKDSFFKALEKNPEHRNALRYCGQLCRKLHDYDKAIQCFKTLQQIDPQDSEVKKWLAELQQQKLD